VALRDQIQSILQTSRNRSLTPSRLWLATQLHLYATIVNMKYLKPAQPCNAFCWAWNSVSIVSKHLKRGLVPEESMRMAMSVSTT